MRRLRPLLGFVLFLGVLACGDRASERADAEPGAAAAGAAADQEASQSAVAEPPARAGPPHARWNVVDMLRESKELRYDVSDGSGRAWLEEPAPAPPQVSSPGRFPLIFEVGPHGIASGGTIYLQVSPFWGWSTPQTVDPAAPGYTEVTTDAKDVVLETQTLDQQLLGIRVAGRALAPGERVRIVYGAGDVGARTDRFAEAFSRFWFAVDGNGDGVRKVLVDSPGIEVLAGAAARLRLTLPTVVRPGDGFRVSVAVLDATGSRGVAFEGEIQLQGAAPLLALPERVTLAAKDRGVVVVEGRALVSGIARVRAAGPDGLEAEGNPLVVTADGPRVLWADLHGHTSWSDGTGTPEDYFLYARDVALLDVVSLTDHDHWGVLPLDEAPERWEKIREAAQRFHVPGHFVTLLGYEWTSWIYGHRHVLYFGDEGRIYSSLDPETETPQQLWAALAGQPALTVAHHSAGDPIPTDWDIPPDPHFEPVTEVVSVHGSSEALDSPLLIEGAVPGNFVRDALDRGYQFGFVGSGDSHDGHPGLAQLASRSGGLAAILSEDLTREGVLAALRERRVYATSGPRIFLRAALGKSRMGGTLRLGDRPSADEELFVHVVGTAPIDRIELIRSGAVADAVDIGGLLDVALQRSVGSLRAGEYVYVRVRQSDGHVAWSSPIFIE